MSSDFSLIELAGAYLTGTLPDDALRRFEARMTDNLEARSAVDRWEARMKEFLGSNAMEALRAGRRGAAPVVSEEHSGPAPRDGARPWADLAPGVRGMGLHYDHLVGTMVYMVRMEPGTHCPAAVDGTPEDCLVVSGDLCLGDVILRAGDNHHAPGSVIHGGGQTEAGAVVLIRARDA